MTHWRSDLFEYSFITEIKTLRFKVNPAITKPAELINFSLVVTAVILSGIHVVTHRYISRVKITHLDIGRKKRRNSLMIPQDEFQPLVKSPPRNGLKILNEPHFICAHSLNFEMFLISNHRKDIPWKLKITTKIKRSPITDQPAIS